MAWIEQLLKEGAKRVDEIEVFYAKSTTVSANLKRRKVNLAVASDDCGLAVRTIRDGRIGSSNTNSPERWRECLKAAIASGDLATPQSWKGLPRPATGPATDTLCFDPALAVEPENASQLLTAMMEGSEEHPADITSGSATLSSTLITLANNAGLYLTSRHTGVSVSLEAISGQSTGSEFAQSCFMDIDPRSVGERAAFFASHSVGGQDIPSGIYDVILSPIAYAELLSAVYIPALSGRNVHAGRSRLATLLNEQVLDARFSVYDNPLLAKGLGSALWDGEGVPTRRIDFIRDGVLKEFAYDLRTAYRYGKTSTGSAIRAGATGGTAIGHHNLIVDGPRTDITKDRAIYIHSVIGAHTANPMSGDFSVEMSNAFWMEDGSFCEPIRSAMLAGNVFDMHASVAGLSREVRQIGSLVLPSIRLSGLRVIGK
ncbi:MAG: peptidase PmbA [Methanoregula sp. PtaU1.Bin051]|nr:MAG: peptidase PmbA [Methanoregula sp. PtaU1.Bin051]